MCYLEVRKRLPVILTLRTSLEIRKFISLNRFSRDIIFSSLVSFAFFGSCFFFFFGILLLFEITNVYSDTHSIMRAGE